ncbi:fluoride efflux transporter CrcB [Candidatus Solincola tengchongensis]|uniref:fluoride efflux transporter CrcB n=1 Tax=Candidatus Solincola tengchongensis TaxID=2900693 RepID=UPI00257BFB2D|nr:fluoride efflux transporter CrcB [Candidatus Solincola tengchongensis]
MTRYLLVAIGGMLGAVARYGLSGWISNRTDGGFPYGTLAVNLLGSFIIGFFLILALERFSWSPGVRLFFAVGFLGAFTTFSTFSYETVELLREGAYAMAALNAGTTLFGCLAATLVGILIAKLI